VGKLEEVRAKIEAQRAAATEQAEAQEAIDAQAVFDIGEELGVTAIREVRIPFIPGLPTLAVVRRPTKIEHKRFTDATARKGADTPEYMKAAEQLAAVCVVYPPKELFEKMCELCPGLKVPMGVAAANLAAGKIADDAK
jgi:hypothetical protein